MSGVVVSAFRARRTTALAAFALLAVLAASAAASPLRDHPSPYLALHADDPVARREWNEAALAEARAGDRLLLVSVGYFSCHWCHVMQRESFRNADIAARINERFIPVKVDRELEPALDARLSEFAEQLLGRSGWPLNVFVTPAGHPLFAVLYMPAGEFGEAIDRMHVLWTEQRERLAGLAARAGERELPEAAAVVDAGAARALEQVFVDRALVLHDDFQGGVRRTEQVPAGAGPGLPGGARRWRGSRVGPRDREDHPRRHGRGRIVRSRRRRLLPLRGRPRLGHASFREDALRQRPAGARVPARGAAVR
ncbi:MAG: thioredoxin domain-containing protein [Gammaproteobacteria bacterium]|nr:thioredoxin domain-containing protein [Gammaproteobacteria bacterium]